MIRELPDYMEEEIVEEIRTLKDDELVALTRICYEKCPEFFRSSPCPNTCGIKIAINIIRAREALLRARKHR